MPTEIDGDDFLFKDEIDSFTTIDSKTKINIFSILYKDLHELAKKTIRNMPLKNDLDTTGLLHETYVKFTSAGYLNCRDRSHFYALASRAMRRILISEARKMSAMKRGGCKQVISYSDLREIDQKLDVCNLPVEQFELLESAIEKLNSIDQNKRLCQIIDLRYFSGFTLDETAEILGVSKGTVRRDWNFIKVWIRDYIEKQKRK